jgi:Fe2+ transport system protein FeoA
MFPLALAGAGEVVTISAIRGGKGLHHKLMELGLRTGLAITVLQKHGGRFVLAHNGQRTALGTGMAQKLFVRLSPPSQAG